MNIDFERSLGAVERSVASLERDGKPARAVTLARTYETGLDDLWDAVTNQERLPRWFAPVAGDFRRGGKYQIEGNAGGEIIRCKKPVDLGLTWVFMEQVSWVDLRLSKAGAGASRLILTHTAPVNEHWEKYGPGAVGVGWELGLLGLALYLANPDAPKVDEAAFVADPKAKAFIRKSADAWGAADIAAGEAPQQAKAAAKRTGDFYTGEGGAGS